MMAKLFREKQIMVLSAIKKENGQAHLSKIARVTETTYVFVTAFVSYCRKNGIVTIKNDGKLRIAELTPKGFELVNAIEDMKKKLE